MSVTPTIAKGGAKARRGRRVPPEEITITVLYMFFGSIWIVVGDQLIGYISEAPWYITAIQSTQGLGFVVASGLLLFVTLRRSFLSRRRAEEALRHSVERVRLTAVTTDAIYDWDVLTNRIWWSESFYTQFGYTHDEVEPSMDFRIRQLHPEEKEEVINSLRRAVSGADDTWSSEYRLRRKDGTYAVVHDRACLVRDRDGRAIRVIGGLSDVTERKENQQKLEQSRQQLRALSARLQSLREEERTHIAREIHDELGQMLTALKMDLRWIEKRIGERENEPALVPLLEKAMEAGEIADQAMSTVQKIAAELRPSTLDNLGLAAALRHEAGKFHERTGIVCEMRLPEETPRLPHDAATAVFRVFQETLTNVARHANATRVDIELRTDSDSVVLQVQDNGDGISAEALSSPKSLGLLGMKERAAVLGGEVIIAAKPDSGTRVTFRVPRTASDTDFWRQITI